MCRTTKGSVPGDLPDGRNICKAVCVDARNGRRGSQHKRQCTLQCGDWKRCASHTERLTSSHGQRSMSCFGTGDPLRRGIHGMACEHANIFGSICHRIGYMIEVCAMDCGENWRCDRWLAFMSKGSCGLKGVEFHRVGRHEGLRDCFPFQAMGSFCTRQAREFRVGLDQTLH